jgi:hypothetical protein
MALAKSFDPGAPAAWRPWTMTTQPGPCDGIGAHRAARAAPPTRGGARLRHCHGEPHPRPPAPVPPAGWVAQQGGALLVPDRTGQGRGQGVRTRPTGLMTAAGRHLAPKAPHGARGGGGEGTATGKGAAKRLGLFASRGALGCESTQWATERGRARATGTAAGWGELRRQRISRGAWAGEGGAA